MSRPRPRSARPAPPRPGPASEFAPGVFGGGWKDAVRSEGSRCCVLDEAPDDLPPATHVRLYDDRTDRALPRRLDALVRAMRAERAHGRPVRGSGGHGVRRSRLAAAGYLHRTEGPRLEAAYAREAAVRPRLERTAEWLGHVDDLAAA